MFSGLFPSSHTTSFQIGVEVCKVIGMDCGVRGGGAWGSITSINVDRSWVWFREEIMMNYLLQKIICMAIHLLMINYASPSIFFQ